MKNVIARILALMVALSASASAYAEVADKIPSLTRLGAEALIVAGLGVVAARYRLWLSVFPVAAAVVLLLTTWDMFQDPALAHAIRIEKGRWYEVSAWFCAVAPLLIVPGVVFVRWRSKRSATAVHDP